MQDLADLVNKFWNEVSLSNAQLTSFGSCYCKKQMRAARSSTATLTMLWRNLSSIRGQTHEKLMWKMPWYKYRGHFQPADFFLVVNSKWRPQWRFAYCSSTTARLNCKLSSQNLGTMNLSFDFSPTRLHDGGTYSCVASKFRIILSLSEFVSKN